LRTRSIDPRRSEVNAAMPALAIALAGGQLAGEAMSTLQRAVSEIREPRSKLPMPGCALLASVCLSPIGGVGMWSVVVAMPALQAEFGVARSAVSLPYTLTMVVSESVVW
jgi:hypothetical protein